MRALNIYIALLFVPPAAAACCFDLLFLHLNILQNPQYTKNFTYIRFFAVLFVIIENWKQHN